MPNWMVEGNVVKPGDDELRTAAKVLQIFYNASGYRPSPFPEGLAPFPGDDLQRIYEKIQFILGGGTGSVITCIPPTTPSNLEALAAGALILDLSWNDNSNNETGFGIRWRNLTTAGAFVNEPDAAADATTGQIDTTGGASDGDNIEVQVQALGTGCNSEWISDTVIVTDTN